MNKLMTVMSLVLGVSLVLAGGTVFAQTSQPWSYSDLNFGGMTSYGGNSGQPMAQATPPSNWQMMFPSTPSLGKEMGGSYHSMGWSTFTNSWLIGHRVFSPTGTALGQISDVVIDQRNDRIALVILSDVPGIGAEKLAVPYSSLIRTGENTFQFSFGDRTPHMSGNSEVNQYTYTLALPPMGSDLYGVPANPDPQWVEHLYRHYGQAPYWAEMGMHPLAANDFYRGSQLMSAPVQAFNGQKAGKVDDFMIDSSNGRIVFVGLSGVQGHGDAMVAVPFGELSRTEGHEFALHISATRLAAAPSFHSYAEVGNRAWAESSYRFFGIQPYWTE